MRSLFTARKALIVAAIAALPVAASAELSFNIGAVSLYKSRGIDQNFGPTYTYKSWRPAIQGGVDYSFDNGIYIGNWNSTGKFDDGTDKSSVEMDFYFGYNGKITEDLSYDIGLVRYVYPSFGALNGNDAYVGLTYGPVTAKYYQGVSGSVKKNKYLTLGVELPISDTVTFNASMGRHNLKDNTDYADYTDYSLGVSYDMGNGLSASVNVVSSNAKDINGVKRDDGKGRLILGISKSF